MGLVVGLGGCQHPSVTAVSLNPHYCDHKFAFLYDPCKEPEGIPFYLPKPLLIVAKNFRNIEETKVGLTDGAPIPNFFDDQAKYADLNARTNFAGLDGNAATGTPAATSGNEQFPTGNASNLATASTARVYSGTTGAPISPGAIASDGLKPDAFYTYHIVFVPDLTQKYGLKIKGGAGEIRAAMNLINGWQFTGLGPYYMKDSSTAQNTLAGGITANLAASGVADVVKAFAGLAPGAGMPGGKVTSAVPSQPGTLSLDAEKIKAVADVLRQLRPKFLSIPAYAEISIYEPYLSPEGTMEWKLVAEKSYDRNVVATDFHPQDALKLLQSATVTPTPATPAPPTPAPPTPAPPPPATTTTTTTTTTAPTATTTTTTITTPPKPAPPKPTAPSLAVPPGATRMPSVQGPRVSLAPGTVPRRSSIRTLAPGDAKADEGVVRTNGTDTPAPLNPDAVANALAQASRAPQAMRLSPTAASGTINDGVTSNPNPAPTAAAPALDRDLLRNMFTQAGALPAAPAPASASVIGVPAGPPSAGNQVNLNQYFGRTKVAASATPTDPATRRFSLFHRKEKARPVVKTINLAGLNAAAVAAAPAGAVAPPPTLGDPGIAPSAAAPGTVAPPPTLGGMSTAPPATAPGGIVPGTGPWPAAPPSG